MELAIVIGMLWSCWLGFVLGVASAGLQETGGVGSQSLAELGGCLLPVAVCAGVLGLLLIHVLQAAVIMGLVLCASSGCICFVLGKKFGESRPSMQVGPLPPLWGCLVVAAVALGLLVAKLVISWVIESL